MDFYPLETFDDMFDIDVPSEYDMMAKDLCTDELAESVVDNNYGKSIEELSYLIELERAKYESTIWFPGDKILIYPSIKTLKAKKFYESPYGKIISPEETYINYRALLINENKASKYVFSKPLRFEVHDELPTNISELEELEITSVVKNTGKTVASNVSVEVPIP